MAVRQCMNELRQHMKDYECREPRIVINLYVYAFNSDNIVSAFLRLKAIFKEAVFRW